MSTDPLPRQGDRVAMVLRAWYFVLVVGLTVAAVAAAYDGAWGGTALLGIAVLAFVAPVVHDGALWNRAVSDERIGADV